MSTLYTCILLVFRTEADRGHLCLEIFECFKHFSDPGQLGELIHFDDIRDLSILIPYKYWYWDYWFARFRLSVHPFVSNAMSPISFEVGIPNLVCGCILGWQSVAYHFLITVTFTFTFDLISRIFVFAVYLLHYLR